MDKIKKTFAEMRRKARESAPERWSRKELAQITLMKGAHQESIAPILRDCPVRVLASGEVLLRAGEPCQALSLVLSGRLRMESPSPTAPDTFIFAGEGVGELFLLQKAVVASTVSAVEATRLLVINRDVAWALIRASHEIARNWLALFAERTELGGTIGGEELKTSHARQTTHDERTGLHNRQWLDSMLPRHIARITASNAPLGLLLVEIDAFADHVARYGQPAEDQAHQLVAKILVDNVRPTDLIVCTGTGRFAAVLPSADAANTCMIGERVRKAVTKAKAALPESGSVTVSVGAAQYQPPSTAAMFLAAAEVALQMAKTAGGNRVGMQ